MAATNAIMRLTPKAYHTRRCCSSARIVASEEKEDQILHRGAAGTSRPLEPLACSILGAPRRVHETPDTCPRARARCRAECPAAGAPRNSVRFGRQRAQASAGHEPR